MRKCNECRIILDENVEFCPKCGKAISGHAGGQTDGGVGALLASANLRRMRGELQAAIDDALQAFQQDPGNAEAASLLGTIYEDTGNLEEAAVWCQVAIDLDPRMPLYRARLYRIRHQMAAQNSALAPIVHFIRKRWAWVAASAAVVLVVVTVLAGSRGPSPKQHRRPVQTAEPARIAAPGEQPMQRPSPSSGVSLSGAQPSASSTLQSRRPGGSGRQPLRTPAEAAIRRSLAVSERVMAVRATIDDVIADPRQAIASVTFSLPSSGVMNRERILVAAREIARETFAANNEVRFVTLRCVVSDSQGLVQIAFVGDTARETVLALAEQQTLDQLAAAFGRPWWNPQIK